VISVRNHSKTKKQLIDELKETRRQLQKLEESGTRHVSGTGLLQSIDTRYRMLFESAPSGIFIFDVEGNVVSVNERASRIYGYPLNEIRKRNVKDFVPHEISKNFPLLVKNVKKKKHLHFESRGKKKNGDIFPVELSVTLFCWGGKDLVQVIAQDITKRKRIEVEISELLKKIEKAKQEWELTADSLPELVCLVVDQGRIIRANRMVEAWKLGRVTDIKGRSVHEVLHPGCKDPSCYLKSFWKRAWSQTSRGRAVQCEAYDTILKRHISLRVHPCNEGTGRKPVSSTVVVVRDITERKRAEEAEHFKRLSKMLINFQEEERKRIARELHDQIGQVLTAIKLTLGLMIQDHPDFDSSLQEEIQESMTLVDSAMDDVRRISSSLRPAILDDFGLIPCIEHEIDFLVKKSNIKIDLVLKKLTERIPPQKEIALYRVVQEALTNIAKHSKATKAKVSLSKRGNKLSLRIQDNGKGFDVGSLRSTGGLGVLGMRERVAAVGGDFRLRSRPGGGVILEVELPIN
jgi:two-component system sensor histidine kinase UhpB